MSAMDFPVQVHVPADLDAPDRIMYGLTARQLAILAGSATVLWLVFEVLTPAVPGVGVGIAAVPVVAVATVVALGRRDGIAMDRWLAAAVAAARSPRRFVAAGTDVPAAPSWAPAAAREPAAVTPLRLPARAISEAGVLDVGERRVTVTAASTVNVALRASEDQHAVVQACARWLNGLSGPVQIVVSTRRVDLHAYADQIEDHLEVMSRPALADAAAGYARFLRWLGEDRDPLDRHVLVAHPTSGDAALARRRAEQTGRALAGVGCATRVLDGGQVTDALVGACDPWRHVVPGRAVPGGVVTAETKATS